MLSPSLVWLTNGIAIDVLIGSVGPQLTDGSLQRRRCPPSAMAKAHSLSVISGASGAEEKKLGTRPKRLVTSR